MPMPRTLRQPGRPDDTVRVNLALPREAHARLLYVAARERMRLPELACLLLERSLGLDAGPAVVPVPAFGSDPGQAHPL